MFQVTERASEVIQSFLAQNAGPRAVRILLQAG
jgi:hypothetical protein